MKILNNPQGSSEWRADRAGVVTASSFDNVLAKIRSGEAASRANYKAQIVAERLTGLPTRSFTSSEMQWGIDHEDDARAIYKAIYGEVKTTGLLKHDNLEAGASPDGLVGEDGLVEIKCPNTANHLATILSRSAPSKYMAQMQGQMWITGRKWCDFVSFDPRLNDKLAFFVTRVNRDEEYIKNLELEVKQFLTEVEVMLKELAAL